MHVCIDYFIKQARNTIFVNNLISKQIINKSTVPSLTFETDYAGYHAKNKYDLLQ